MAEDTRSGAAAPLVSGADIRTFLFADMRGYTQYTREHGDDAASALAGRFADLVKETVPEYEGELLELRGDEALCVFRSARQALRAAVELQRRLRTATDEGPAFLIGVGVGLDAGEAVPTHGGYRGAALNLAARLCAVAKPGEILASETVIALASRVDGMRYLEGRSATLKGMARPVRYVVVEPEKALPAVPSLASSPRRSWRRLAAAGGVVAVVAIFVGLWFSGRGGSSRVGLAEDSFALVSSDGRTSGNVALGAPPAAVTTGDGAVWLADYEHGAVVEVSPTSGQRQSIPVGAGPDAVAVGAGLVWIANAGDGTVSEINAAAGRVVGNPIYVGNGPSGIVATNTAVWVALSVDGAVAKIDPSLGRVVRTYPAGADPTRITFGFGKLWVTNESVGTVTPIDPASGMAESPIHVGRGPNGITTGAGAVWVTNSLDGTVSRINPDSLTVTTYPVGSDPQGVVVIGTDVWVAASGSAQLVRIDASTGRTINRLATGADPQQLAVSGTGVAVTTASIPSRHRGGTLRIAVPPLAGSIDPQSAAAWLAQPWATFAMTNDGLLGLKRAAGPEGETIVADLAKFIPAPAPGGRTYTFQLRRGLRYSTGARVKASDIRNGIERSFTVNARLPDFGDLGETFFSDIVGAKRCEHRPHCDLSQGIVTDDQAGQITFHLTQPDPNFLAKLAMPIAAAVPPTVTSHDSGPHPLPATGAYEITQYDPRKGAVLVRNPHFHEWSRDAQPAGYPNRIVFHVYPTVDKAITAVEHGHADLLFGIQTDGVGGWSPSASTMRQLATQYATQIHPAIVSGTEMLTMPQWLANDRPGRLAISYALDRRKISTLLGGPLLAQPTCQLLPPNFPGYRPYCPYSINPGDHPWSAPDLLRAQQLAKRSRNRGRPIIVQSPSPLSTYLVQLLDRLGYKAHLQTKPNQQTIGLNEFAEDYPGAADFIQIYAPPFLQHRVDIALRQQLESPYAGTLAWAAIDRQLTNYAAPFFIATDRNPGFVSKRVGNFITSPGPGNGPVIDQLWVR